MTGIGSVAAISSSDVIGGRPSSQALLSIGSEGAVLEYHRDLLGDSAVAVQAPPLIIASYPPSS